LAMVPVGDIKRAMSHGRIPNTPGKRKPTR
jgi:hypothetical protein